MPLNDHAMLDYLVMILTPTIIDDSQMINVYIFKCNCNTNIYLQSAIIDNQDTLSRLDEDKCTI